MPGCRCRVPSPASVDPPPSASPGSPSGGAFFWRFELDIQHGSWVLWLAMTSGFRPSKRRPLPGNAVLWRACVTLGHWVQHEQARLESLPSRPVFAEPPEAAGPQASELG